jgi:hypothetical protein
MDSVDVINLSYKTEMYEMVVKTDRHCSLQMSNELHYLVQLIWLTFTYM